MFKSEPRESGSSITYSAISTRSAGYRSRHGHTAVWEHNIYQVFMSAIDEDAETFRVAFNGERMHPLEKGMVEQWSTWRKGTYNKKLI